MSTTKVSAEQAVVQDVPGGFHLVTVGEWQVSVMSDGMISLPRLVRPQDIDDFCAAMMAAKEVGLKQQAENGERAKAQHQALAARQESYKASALRSTRRERNAGKAKADRQARAGGPRGASKTQLTQGPATRSENGSAQEGNTEEV